MNIVKCMCGAPKCEIRIRRCEKNLFLQDKFGKEHLMYLTPNTIVDLITMLREILDSMAKGEGE